MVGGLVLDVLKLDNATYQPTDLIENLSTKIWTERYSTFGEFEFRSSDIAKCRKLLPENSLVTLRDSDEVMLVETHNIDKDGDVGQVLVIKGRSAECILESRAWAGGRYSRKVKMRQKYSIQNAIVVFMTNVLNNYTSVDLASAAAKGRPNLNNNIPNLRITDGTHASPVAKVRYLTNTQAWDYVSTMLAAGKLGIRTIRPRTGQAAKKTVKVAANGTITKPVETTTGLTIDVFDGVDRSDGQTTNPQVVFASREDHITDPAYVLSSEKYKEFAIVISASGPVGKGKEITRVYDPDEDTGQVKQPPIGRPTRGSGDGYGFAPGEPPPAGTGPGKLPPESSGFGRREILIDAGTKDDDETTSEFLASLDDVGSDTLKADWERTTSVDGTISSTIPYKYKVDYDLGDKVTLIGQFGIEQDMRVEEYTRTEDGEGERAFPGLVLWT